MSCIDAVVFHDSRSSLYLFIRFLYFIGTDESHGPIYFVVYNDSNCRYEMGC